jgi:hypothetical protein
MDLKEHYFNPEYLQNQCQKPVSELPQAVLHSPVGPLKNDRTLCALSTAHLAYLSSIVYNLVYST